MRAQTQVTPPPTPYFVTDASGSAMIVGVPFSVAPRQEHQIMIVTRRVIPHVTNTVSYQFTIRKQAGVNTYPWHVVVHYPSAWTATSESGIAKPGILEYNTDLTQDASMRALFQK